MELHVFNLEWCLQDHVECWGLNSGRPHVRQKTFIVPAPLPESEISSLFWVRVADEIADLSNLFPSICKVATTVCVSECPGGLVSNVSRLYRFVHLNFNPEFCSHGDCFDSLCAACSLACWLSRSVSMNASFRGAHSVIGDTQASSQRSPDTSRHFAALGSSGFGPCLNSFHESIYPIG